MSSTRQPFFWGFIGHNRTGKTSTAILIAKQWKQKNVGCKIIGFDPQRALKKANLMDYEIFQKDKNWAEILLQRDKKTGDYKFRNSLLILDDYRILLKNNNTPDDVLDLLQFRNDMGLDIIYITHNPKLILERFAYFSNFFSVFYTQSHSNDWEEKITKYDACQKASNLVNKYVITYGRGTYPNFPHVMVNNESDELDIMNMDEEKVMAILPDLI